MGVSKANSFCPHANTFVGLLFSKSLKTMCSIFWHLIAFNEQNTKQLLWTEKLKEKDGVRKRCTPSSAFLLWGC